MFKFLIPLVALVATSFPAVAEITMETCKADHAAMLAAAENNRKQSIHELEQALRLTKNEEAVGALNHEMEQTWNLEEQFRKQADDIYRDCVKYVKSGGS